MDTTRKTLMVVSSLASHIAGYYVIGATKDDWLTCYRPNLASLLFVLAISLLLTQVSLMPITPYPVNMIYFNAWHVLGAVFMSSLALRLIWLPIAVTVSHINHALSHVVRMMIDAGLPEGPLEQIIEIFECTNLENVQLLGLSLVNLHIILHATDSYTNLRCLYEDLVEKLFKKKIDCEPPAEVPPPCPPPRPKRNNECGSRSRSTSRKRSCSGDGDDE